MLGYAAHSANAPLVPYTFERRLAREDDVVIDILYCGVCHSDLHHVQGDWHTNYPVVPGHEIIGRVASVGSKVTRFNVGDHVGVGCMVDSCRHCNPCTEGLEQYCEEGNTLTYNSLDRHDHMPTYGGYSKQITVSDAFVLKIPQGVDLKSAAPLLCAGITTWSPLVHWHIKEGSNVAVIGLGGLGHMAIKLAKGLGAHVTLFSRSPNKIEDAYRLGANRVVISTDEKQLQAVQGKFDLIIDTVPYDHDINPYIPTLAVSGTIVMVGYLGKLANSVNSGALILGRKAVAGSVIGGIKETQEMLDFCGEHGINPDVEVINMPYINEAYQRMLKSDVKYRFVIDMSTLKE